MVVQLAISFVICLTAFTLLKTLITAIPTRLVRQSLTESASILKTESSSGRKRILYGEQRSTQLDNYTTALMLNTIANDHATNLLDKAFGDYYYDGHNATGNRQAAYLIDVLDGTIVDKDANWPSYARYWNGYVCALKPLLIFLNLNQVRMIFAVSSSLMLILCISQLARMRSTFAGVAFGLPFFAVNYLIAITSLSLAFTFLIALCASLFVIARASSPVMDGVAAWAVPFFVIGGLTAFFDFLCTPLITLGIPLALLLYLSVSEDWRAYASLLVCAGICWSLGYGLLWTSKWALSSLVLHRNVLFAAMGAVSTRTAGLDGHTLGATVLAVIKQNATLLFPSWARKALSLPVALALLDLLRRMLAGRLRGVRWAQVATLLVVAVLPYLWYCFAANHSYIHCWFTYRGQLVALVSMLFAYDLMVSHCAS